MDFSRLRWTSVLNSTGCRASWRSVCEPAQLKTAVSNPGQGHYTITFNTPFAGSPTVTATAEHQGADTEKVVMTDGVTSANAMLATRSIIFGGGFVNMTFHFIAVGPR